MFNIFISALIFGFVHPGSKLLLDQGIPLSYFCLLYIGIRCVAQLPFVFIKSSGIDSRFKNSKIFYYLITIGLVGALLQFFEFKGIDQGLPPATTTFLMFTYPIWIVISNFINKSQSVGVIEIVQSISIVMGIYFLSHAEFSIYNFKSTSYLYPLIASILIAAWIILTNQLRKEGVGIFQLSVYYDFFSLVALFVIFSGKWVRDWPQFLLWSHNEIHIFSMILYSIMIGLLPNFLFYFGSRQVSSHFAGTILALEPIFSGLYSAIVWPSTFGNYFLVGGFFILLANIPKEILVNTLQKVAYEK